MYTITSNCVNYKTIYRIGSECARTVDANYKNKWKWSRLEEKDINGDCC